MTTTFRPISDDVADTRYDNDSNTMATNKLSIVYKWTMQCSQIWNIHTIDGRIIGLETSASQWHSHSLVLLHSWWPICTVSDVETPSLVHIAMVLTRRQNIWCYTAQRTTRRGGSHGQISTTKAIEGAFWRGSGR